MKTFFQQMNLARAIMLLALIGSVVLASIGWKHHTELEELRLNEDKDVPKLVQQIEQLARRHTQLSKALRQENLVGQADLESYIRKVATADKVEVGDLKLLPADDQRTKGIVDKKYTIKISDRERQFARSRISNFLYKLESESRRVKVTHLVFETAEKKLKPHELPNDMWTFEAEVTSRQRVEEGGPSSPAPAAAK